MEEVGRFGKRFDGIEKEQGEDGQDPEKSHVFFRCFNFQVNPLLLPNIAKEVLSYLPLNDLEASRDVCSVWRAQSVTFIRRKRVVFFSNGSQIEAYIRAMSTHLMNEKSFPDRSFKFDRVENTISLLRFFHIFGQHAYCLDLCPEFWATPSEFREILSFCPHLEHLTVYLTCFRSPVALPQLGSLRTLSLGGPSIVANAFLRDMVSAAPNLVKISSSSFPNGRRSQWSPSFQKILFHSIVMSTGVPRLSFLSHLDISMQLREAELNALASRHYPLRVLTLGVCSDVVPRTLELLLNNLALTLEKLTLNFHPEAPSASTRITANLPGLKSLSLCRYQAELNFIRHSPHLKRLILGRANLNRAFPPGGLLPRKANLEEVYLQWDDAEIGVLESIALSFPSLKVFSMLGATDETLRVVFRNMPFLENFTVLQGNFTDSGISGLPARFLKQVQHPFEPGRVRDNIPISVLINLKKLKLMGNGMSDNSIFYGIAECSKLEHLTLTSPEVTDFGLIAIGQMASLNYINLSGCESLSPFGKAKVREKWRGKKFALDTPRQVESESRERARVLQEVSVFQEDLKILPISRNASNEWILVETGELGAGEEVQNQNNNNIMQQQQQNPPNYAFDVDVYEH